MRIEDYMDNKIEKTAKSDEERYNIYYDVRTFSCVSKEKCELLESVVDYLKTTYNAETDYEKKSNFTMIQGEMQNGSRILMSIDLIERLEESDDDWVGYRRIFITRDKFDRLINRYKRVGSQNYGFIELTLGYVLPTGLQETGTFKKMIIYYSEDGHVFLSRENIRKLGDLNIDWLGRELAKKLKCTSRENLSEKGKIYLKK